MSAPDYQELATLGDFLRLGLPPDALRLARTTHAPLTVTGGGAGYVVPEGTLDVGTLERDALPVLVEVVAGGAPGVATWRWSTDGGATWTTTAATPEAGTTVPLAMPTHGTLTGLSVRFAGTLVTGARYAWTSVSCVRDCLRAGNEEAARYLARRFNFPLSVVPTDIVRDTCILVSADVAAVIGYRPGDENDLFEKRAGAARKRFEGVRDNEVQPRVAETGTPRMAPRSASRTRR